MSRGISTKAQEYDISDLDPVGSNATGTHVEQDVPRPSKVSVAEVGRIRNGANQHCTAKPRRILHDPNPQVSRSFTDDQYAEERKQQKLMERVRYLASDNKY